MAAGSVSSHKRPSIVKVNEMVKKTERWDVYASGRQNLAAALNDPQNREVDLFTKTWGEAFVPNAPLPPSNIPHVTKEHFKEYMKLTRQGRKVHAKIDRELNVTSLESPKETKFVPNDITVVEQDGRKYDLGTIPRIFFHSSFALENQNTFEEILPIENIFGLGDKEAGDVVRKYRTPPTDKLLHEKLTHHLDLVEVHLGYQVAQRADTFFASISSHDLLKDEIKKLLIDLSESRSHLKRSDSTVANDHIHLLHYSAKRYRCQLVYNKLKVLWAVQQTPPTIKLLLSTSDFIGALDLIASTKEALQTELVGIHCVRHLYSELHELEKAIEKMMEDDFAALVLEYIKELVAEQQRRGSSDGEVSALEERLVAVVIGLIRQKKVHFLSALRDVLLPWTKSLVRETARKQLRMREGDSPVESEENVKMGDLVRGQEFRSWLDLLECVFKRMIDCLKATKRALDLFKEVIKSECVDLNVEGSVSPGSGDLPRSPSATVASGSVRDLGAVVRDNGPHSQSEITGVDYESVARNLEADERMDQLLMEDEVSLAMMSGNMSMATVGMSTRQESTDADKLTDQSNSKSSEVSSSSSLYEIAVNGRISVTDCRRLLSECHELLCTMADFAHGRCTKLLGFRAKAGKLENLHSNEFTSLVRLIEKFVNNTADITGRQCPSLRAPLLSHSKKFLEQFHETRRTKLSLLMDSERWKQSDVPPEIQQVVIALETSKSKILEVQTPLTQQSKDYLTVKGQSFSVVGVVLLLVKIMMEYCQCAADLPTLAYDVMGKLVDVMKFFNTRACQLVLGAGAVQSIGIKTITARHLGLVYRCLQAIILLIPDLRGYFQQYLSKQHTVLLTQFDRLLQDYQSHCRELAKKLKTIMEDGFVRHLTKWEFKAPIPSNSFKAITKQMVKLHEALVDILPEDQLSGVFAGIEEVLCHHMRQCLTKAGITNNGSTQHGVVNSEITHFRGTIASLEGLDKFGESLFNIWTSSN